MFLEHSYEKVELKQDVKLEKEKAQKEKDNKLFKGYNNGTVLIPKIKLNKVLVKSSITMLQDNIDLNNLVTINDFASDKIVIYGHYTKIKGLVLNRVGELRINDLVLLKKNKELKSYMITKIGTTKNEEELITEDDFNLVIITCTKKFDNDKKFYVKAREHK